MHLVGYLYEDYHDARSLEHKVIVTNSGPLGCEAVSFGECLPTVGERYVSS
jgi:hypothetical protein